MNNADRVPSLAQRYGVRAIPTVLIIENGKEINRLAGLRTEAEYVALCIAARQWPNSAYARKLKKIEKFCGPCKAYLKLKSG